MSSPNNNSPSPNNTPLKANNHQHVGNSNANGDTSQNIHNTHLSPNSGFASGKHIHHKNNLTDKKNMNKAKGLNKYRPKTNKNSPIHQKNSQQAATITPSSRFPPNKYQYSPSEMIKIRDARKNDPKPSDLESLYCYNEKGNLYEIKLEQLARSKQKLQEKKMKESFFGGESDDKKDESKRFEKKRISREGNFPSNSQQTFSRKQIPHNNNSNTNSRNTHGIDRFNDETFNVSIEELMATPFTSTQLEKTLTNPVGGVTTVENISNIANQNNDNLSSQLINKPVTNQSHTFTIHDDGEDTENVGWEDDYFSMSLIDNHTDDTSEVDQEDLLVGSKLMKWKQNQPKEESKQDQLQENSNILSKLFPTSQSQPSQSSLPIPHQAPQMGAAGHQGFFPPPPSHSTSSLPATSFSGQQFIDQFKNSIHINPTISTSPPLHNVNPQFGNIPPNHPPKISDNNNNIATSPRSSNHTNTNNLINNNLSNQSLHSSSSSATGSIGSNTSQGFSFSDFVKNVNMNQPQQPFPNHLGNNFTPTNSGPMTTNAPMQWPTTNKSQEIGNTLLSMLKNPKGNTDAATPVNNSFELPHVPFSNFYKNNYASPAPPQANTPHSIPINNNNNINIAPSTNININHFLPPSNNYGIDIMNALKNSENPNIISIPTSLPPQHPVGVPQNDSLSKLFPPVDTSHFSLPFPNTPTAPVHGIPFPIHSQSGGFGGMGGAPPAGDPLEKWFGKLPVPHMGGPLVGSLPVSGLSAQEIENKLANK